MTRGEERFNALLSAVLLLGILVLVNRIASRHLVVRHDFSEDQLYAVSEATLRTLGRLEDRLQVKAYFTGDIQSGQIALAKARLEGLLAEFAALSGGRLHVDTVDPNTSSEALSEAQELGLFAFPAHSVRGIQRIRQDVYLGLVLRYRGREEVLPFVSPNSFEIDLSSRIYSILRETKSVVGWFGADPAPGTHEAQYGTFTRLRGLLSQQHLVETVEYLASGAPVPERVDVLLVVRPKELHPRAAFAIDQFVQRGGRLVVFVDQAEMGRSGEARISKATGLEELLELWGALPGPHHVWDTASFGKLPMTRNLMQYGLEYPLFVRMRADSFDATLPPAANLQDGVFCWAQPIKHAEPLAGGTRVILAQSSPDSYYVDLTETVLVDADMEDMVKSVTASLYARGEGQRYALAVVLSGRFPSPFEDGAPAPWDPLADSDKPLETTDETVLSWAADSQVVVFGDADWVRDGYLRPPNERLVSGVVDWLTLDEDLVAMRTRVPRDRRIRDFLQEERIRVGASDSEVLDTTGEIEREMKLEEAAARAARRRQWTCMLAPILGTLALVFGFGIARTLLGRRAAEREA